MKKVINIYKEYQEIMLLFFLFFLFTFIMSITNHMPILGGLSIFLFESLGMLVPGIAFMLVLNIKLITKLEFVAVSYAIGYCFTIILYYLFVPIGMKQFIWIGYGILVVSSIILFVKKGKNFKELERDGKGNIVCGIFIFLLLVLEFFSYNQSNMLPFYSKETDLMYDLMYWVGNSVALSKEYPIADFREFTRPYTYHFFSSMQMTVVFFMTKTQPIVFALVYSFIQPILFLVFGSYCFFRRCSKRLMLTIIAMIVLFFVTGREAITYITYAPHMYVCQFGYDIGLGCLMLVLFIIVKQLEEKKWNYRWYFLFILLFFMLVGLKSPSGAIAFGILGFVCLYWLWKKNLKPAFVYGVSAIIIFITMYIFVVNMSGWSLQKQSFENSISIYHPVIYGYSEILNYFHNELIHIFGNGIGKILVELITSIVLMIFSNYVIYVVFWIMIPVKAILLKKWDIFDSACVLSSLVGTLITLNWGNQDSSVMYFTMIPYVTSVFFCLKAVNQCLDKKELFNKWIRILFYLGFCVFLFFGMKDFWSKESRVQTAVMEGISNFTTGVDTDVQTSAREYISQSEYKAYDWIRTHTDENTLITSNKCLERGREETSRHSRMVGVFAERYCVTNEDTDIMFYDLDYSRLDAITSLGIEYVLYNKVSTANFSLTNEQAEIVFENDSTVIYKLK